MHQSNLLGNTVKFNNKPKPKTKEIEAKNEILFSVDALYGGRELTPNAFKSGIL